MILYDVKCAGDHVFEAWFRDGKSFDTQSRAKKVLCPVCGSTKVTKALMAPNIAIRKEATSKVTNAEGNLREMLGQLRQQVEKNCDYVGTGFAEEARRIHYGETEERNIYGEASEQEASDLEEEGVSVGRIPWLPRTDS